MKQARRILSLLLALTLVCGLAVSAAAAEPVPVENKTKIDAFTSITLPGTNANQDINLDVYKVVKVIDLKESAESDAEMVTEAARLEWAGTLKEEVVKYMQANAESLKDAAGNVIDLTNPSNLTTLNKLDTSATKEKISHFYRWLAGVIRDGNVGVEEYSPAPTGTANADSTVFTYDNSTLETGGYLALANGGTHVYHPIAFNYLPSAAESGDGMVYPTEPLTPNAKYSQTHIEKIIIDNDVIAEQTDFKNAAVSYADDVTFKVETGVPVYSSDYDTDTIVYRMVDIYRNAYSPKNVVVTGHNTGDDTPDTLTPGTNYTLTTNGTVYMYNNAPLFVSLGGKFYNLSGKTLTGATLNEVLAELGEDYTTQTVTASAEYGAFMVDFTTKFGTIAQYNTIGYQYDATITTNEQIDTDTNTNYANLAYSVNASNTTEVNNIDDSVKSYTYGIEVKKIDGNTGVGLNGVSFALYKELSTMTDEEYAELLAEKGLPDNTDQYKTTEAPVEGSVVVYEKFRGDLVTANTAPAELPEGAKAEDYDGKLNIKGLDVGNYLLVEVSTLDGYNLLGEGQKITITPAANNPKDVVTTTEHTPGYYALTVSNFRGVTLPSTGGMGTVLFTMGGIGIMACAMFLLIMKRRREEEAF